MLFTKLAPLAAAFSLAAAQVTEIVDGVTFIKSGPKEDIPKEKAELDFARYALDLLKTRVGPDGLIELLQSDIKEAETFWHDVIDKSTGEWVPTDGRVIGFFPDLTAAAFAAWSQSPFADKSNNAANPEHYVKRTEEISPGVLQSEILEGWGGVTTHFSILNYGPPNATQHPMLRELPEFPFQAAGDKALKDGDDTVFGVLHISVRDVKGADYDQEMDGIEIFATVWYGDGVDDAHLEDERQHIVIEIINQSIQAQKDLESGDFVPELPEE